MKGQTTMSKTMTSAYNALSILGTYNKTVYVRIPADHAETICGGCACDYCKAHPHLTPKWDTLCVPAGRDANLHTWTVHMPVVADFLRK